MRAFERFRRMDTRTDAFERRWAHFKGLYWHDKQAWEGGATVLEFGFYTGRRDLYHRCRLEFPPRRGARQTARLVVATHETRGGAEPPLVTRTFDGLRSFDGLVGVLESCRWYGDLGVARIPHVWREGQQALYVRWEE